MNDHAAPAGTADVDYTGRPADVPKPSPRLYNNDLAPVQRDFRPWGAYNVFTLWANDVHSLVITPLPSACSP